MVSFSREELIDIISQYEDISEENEIVIEETEESYNISFVKTIEKSYGTYTEIINFDMFIEIFYEYNDIDNNNQLVMVVNAYNKSNCNDTFYKKYILE